MTITQGEQVYFLLVDDLEENLLSLEALLQKDELVLLKASSGPEALELLLKYEVALALLDVQMPGMDGFELAEIMRGSERTRRIPLIFLTAGSADWQRRFRGYEAGAVDFIHKPIEPDILKSKAGVFFELYRQQQLLIQQRDALKLSAEENARLLQESIQYAEALKETDRRKDEFLATLAHELRNPLAPIRNGLHILQTTSDSKISDNVRDMMDRQLTHLVRLIDDLLDVARVSQGKIDLRKEYITLQEVVKLAVETSRPFIDKDQHTLTINMPQTPIWLNADLTRLAQVLGNLLNNSAKYTSERGDITVSIDTDKKDVFIEVADNGMGIPKNMLPKVFELFTQVDHNLEHSQGGLGIGLALVKRLVEMHDGIITAESQGLGKGSIFTIRIPFMPDVENVSDTAEAHDAQEVVTPLNVLVVDDNIDSAKTTCWMLEFIGYNPTMVHDGSEALEMAKTLKPDVILLDIGLPGINGYEVCRELRKDPQFKDTLLIALTGWGQARDKQEAYEAGFNHHLIKPVKFEDISALLSQAKSTPPTMVM